MPEIQTVVLDYGRRGYILVFYSSSFTVSFRNQATLPGGGEGGGRRVTAAGREAGKRTNATTVRSSPQREALSRGGMHRLGVQIEGADDRSP